MHNHFKTSLTSLFLLFFSLIKAQDYDNFETIKSVGTIPSDFYTLSSDKYKTQTEVEVSKSDKKKVAKSKESFILESNFVLDQLLTSGNVLFNDSLSIYVNKVADEILKDDPKLRKEIRFYVVKSPYVNAFSTAQGYVLVNIGLLAQIENEAQLAFILCHEIIHYKNKHAISQKVNYDAQIEKKGETSYGKMLAQSAYSKDLESESDIEGLRMYMKTKYSKQMVYDVFDVLKYSSLPYDEIPFQFEYLESSFFKINKEYKSDTVSDIKIVEEDDELSTHPNIHTRVGNIKNELKKYSDRVEGEEFILSENYFRKISSIARHELSNLFINENEYSSALYNSFLLLKSNPNNTFAKVQTLNALYFLVKYSNRNDIESVINTSENVQGESFKVSYFLEKIKKNELNILAINYAEKLKIELKDDEVVSKICDDLLKELVEQCELTTKDFEFTPTSELLKRQDELKKKEQEQAQNKESLEKVDESITSVKKSKYDKIKEKEVLKEDKEIIEEVSFKNAFSDLCFDETFHNRFKKIEEEIAEDKKIKASEAYKLKNKELKKQNKKKGVALGIDHVIVVNPEYYQVDERKKENIEYLNSEISKENQKGIITDVAKQIGLKLDYLNPEDMKGSDVISFNDLALLNAWVDEKSSHSFDYISVYQREIDELIKRRGTNYASWIGIINVREKKGFNPAYCYAVMMPYVIPVIIGIALMPKYDTRYYNITYDLKTGEKVFTTYKEINMNDKDFLVKSCTYEAFYQVKNKRKIK